MRIKDGEEDKRMVEAGSGNSCMVVKVEYPYMWQVTSDGPVVPVAQVLVHKNND